MLQIVHLYDEWQHDRGHGHRKRVTMHRNKLVRKMRGRDKSVILKRLQVKYPGHGKLISVAHFTYGDISL
jgi:hypothetical protein